MTKALARQHNQKPKLPDGREIRVLADGRKNAFTQVEVFGVAKLLLPSESIMTVEEYDQSIQLGTQLRACKKNQKVNPSDVWRCNEYEFHSKNYNEPLGKEIILIENGVTYKKLIPDVPVKVNGREISLQNAVGKGVYDSIGLLKIEQTDNNLFVVSVIDPATVIGKVRVTNMSGLITINFNDKAITGYHGSKALSFGFLGVGSRGAIIIPAWSGACGVAVVKKLPKISFEEPNGQHPYRDAPRVVNKYK